MRKKGIQDRRQGAYDRLVSSKFYPKKDKKGNERNEDTWLKYKTQTMENLEKKGVQT